MNLKKIYIVLGISGLMHSCAFHRYDPPSERPTRSATTITVTVSTVRDSLEAEVIEVCSYSYPSNQRPNLREGDCEWYDDFIHPYSEEHLVYEKTANWEYRQPNSRQIHRDYYEGKEFRKSCRIRYDAFQQISHIKVVHFKFNTDEIFYRYESTVLMSRKIYPANGETFIERYQYDLQGNVGKKIFYHYKENKEIPFLLLEYKYE